MFPDNLDFYVGKYYFYTPKVKNSQQAELSKRGLNHGFKKFLSNKIDEIIFLSPTYEQKISKEISKLKPNKSSGPDGISPRLIKDCAPCIIKPLTIIFNNSLETAKYPSALKIAKVLALYKKNEMYLPDNYRPISLLSCFDNFFEKIIYRRLIYFI